MVYLKQRKKLLEGRMFRFNEYLQIIKLLTVVFIACQLMCDFMVIAHNFCLLLLFECRKLNQP